MKLLEGSNAIAHTIRLCRPGVVSAYPITPQTHIVEDLAKFKADGEVDYEYVRAESEFSAASIVAGASAAGARAYSATSSQGLLLMTEVVFNIAGMRLPVVMTCANRAVSAPINIWNDQQDAMTVRDAGWIMLFAETNQEAVEMHIQAFKVAETMHLPVMVNVDGFVLTHTFEPVEIPTQEQVNKFLPPYNPAPGEYLDIKNPKSFGCFVAPDSYQEVRMELQSDIINSVKMIDKVWREYQKDLRFTIYDLRNKTPNPKIKTLNFLFENGLVEYYGEKNAKTVIVAMGSVCGTIKDAMDEHKNTKTQKHKNKNAKNQIGLLRIKSFRPFPDKEVIKILSKAKKVVVLDKSISLGAEGVLASEIKRACYGQIKANIKGVVMGLGGKDITKEEIKNKLKQ